MNAAGSEAVVPQTSQSSAKKSRRTIPPEEKMDNMANIAQRQMQFMGERVRMGLWAALATIVHHHPTRLPCTQ